MHRLLKLNNEQLCKVQNVLLSSRKNEVDSKVICFCGKNVVSSKVSVRYQSTNINPSIQTKKTRKKRAVYPRKYVELLVVGNNSTIEQKTSVKKLKVDDLKHFVGTSFNLGELYKLKSSHNLNHVEEHTYNNLTVIPLPQIVEESTSVEVEGENENVEELQVPALIKTVKLGSFQPETIEEDHSDHLEPEETKTSAKVDKKADNLAARNEAASKTLAAYAEVCSILRTPQKGINALNFHRLRVRRSSQKTPVKDVRVYNALLKGFTSKGDLAKLREVLKYADEEGVALDVQSYVAIFECLARTNLDENNTQLLRLYVRNAKKQGITFDRIMNEGLFATDQRETVLKAMRMYQKDYEPKYKLPPLHYNNHLLNHLNCEEQLALNASQTKSCGIFSGVEWNELINKQLKVESEGFLKVKSVELKDEPSEDVKRYRKAFDDHIELWEKAASEAFSRDLATLAAQRNPLNLEPYMRCIPMKDFVQIIVEEAKKIAQGSETYSPTVNLLNKDLGTKVYARYKVLHKQKTGVLDKTLLIHKKYCKDYGATHGPLDVLPHEETKVNTRQKWQLLEHSLRGEGASFTLDHQEWVPNVLHSIGKFLYHIVMHDLKINVNSLRNHSKHKNYLPAFYTVFRNQGRIVKEEVKPHPILCKLYRASQQEHLTFPSYEVPMFCPPVPWVSVKTGGYLIAPCDMVRLPSQAVAQKQRLEEADPRNIYPSIDSLNQLTAVPWRVNPQILDVILNVFRSGGSSKLDVPEPPSSLPPPQLLSVDITKVDRYNLFRQKLQHKRKQAEMYSLWCDCLYRLSLANHFRDEIFWLPHNMDFRGRVYPVPPHLNHLGSDLARSMLVFAEARPLGDKGLDWLKLHLVNLTGLMKHDPLEERLKFANNIIDKILDSADNPLHGEKWWMDSDEPWQTLACCMEIAKAMRSPDPKRYMSHFPIHQDGSCNGLQHYAALGRDSAGAFSVNLTASRVPQDVYSAVAVLVERQRRNDAEKGVQIAQVLDGFVRRKVIKQTVMTTVYGVTRYGARLQIAKQLKDIDDFPKESVWAASAYLTARTFESLRTMFTSTREIQDWFTDCARLISSVVGENVEWVTPLGLPVVQPYLRFKKLSPSSSYDYYHMDKYEKPNVMKQKNAFPPNFIHSLDSSHMMLTSLHCERAGITFVSVHDCYWTHPSTVHIMNKICREQFVALHSEPILEELSVFLSQKYSYDDNEFLDNGSSLDLTRRKLNKVLRDLPKTGDFDIREVLNSIYFFS